MVTKVGVENFQPPVAPLQSITPRNLNKIRFPEFSVVNS